MDGKPFLRKGSEIDNYEYLRNRMVDEQLLARGIKDYRVLSAMRKVPRHLFVDEELRGQAYGDYALPIGEGQTISQPYMVGVMTEALELKGDERVLEIGTGSGYQTAILAELAWYVYSVERLPSLAIRAKRLLEDLGYFNISITVSNGTLGWKEESPFEGIIVTAGAPEIPDSLLEQLSDGGRMIIPVGDRYSQVLTRVVKRSGKVLTTPLFPCVFVPLIGEFGWER